MAIIAVDVAAGTVTVSTPGPTGTTQTRKVKMSAIKAGTLHLGWNDAEQRGTIMSRGEHAGAAYEQFTDAAVIKPFLDVFNAAKP